MKLKTKEPNKIKQNKNKHTNKTKYRVECWLSNVPGHGACYEMGLIFWRHSFNSRYHLQMASWSFYLSLLGFYLTGIWAGFEHTATASVNSYAHHSCFSWKTLHYILLTNDSSISLTVQKAHISPQQR